MSDKKRPRRRSTRKTVFCVQWDVITKSWVVNEYGGTTGVEPPRFGKKYANRLVAERDAEAKNAIE